ncbi:MAG: type II secretion system GspH family protein [Candidatus Accumulibacter sp.]|nr:type II secretion system GspH family protein [Accumulibacter sp.]
MFQGRSNDFLAAITDIGRQRHDGVFPRLSPHPPRSPRPAQRGFTLIEAIMVIVITGIVAAMVAVFIRRPIDAYMDTARRAALADIADTAARFIARDVQRALPNSARSGNPAFLEFVPVVAAGRYRRDAGISSSDEPLDFGGPGKTFDVLGPAIDIPANASLVVYNLGIPGADVYETNSKVRRPATPGTNLDKVTFSGDPLAWTQDSPGRHFQIVVAPVSYVCDFATGTLWRYSGYAFQENQPLSVADLNGLGAARAPLATRLSACNFTYGPGPLQQNGLVSMSLSFSQDGETVTLLHQVNIDNVP